MEMKRDDWWIVAQGNISELADVVRRVKALRNPTHLDYGEIQYRIGNIQTALAQLDEQESK